MEGFDDALYTWGAYAGIIGALMVVCLVVARSWKLAVLAPTIAIVYQDWELGYGKFALKPYCDDERRAAISPPVARVGGLAVIREELCVNCLAEYLFEGYDFIEFSVPPENNSRRRAERKNHLLMWGIPDITGLYSLTLHGNKEQCRDNFRTGLTASIIRECFLTTSISHFHSEYLVEQKTGSVDKFMGKVLYRETKLQNLLTGRVYAQTRLNYRWIPLGPLGRNLNPEGKPRFAGAFVCEDIYPSHTICNEHDGCSEFIKAT